MLGGVLREPVKNFGDRRRSVDEGKEGDDEQQQRPVCRDREARGAAMGEPAHRQGAQPAAEAAADLPSVLGR